MIQPQAVKFTSTYYHADVHCALIEDLCDFSASGLEARLRAINHTKRTGHKTIVRVQATEEIEVTL